MKQRFQQLTIRDLLKYIFKFKISKDWQIYDKFENIYKIIAPSSLKYSQR